MKYLFRGFSIRVWTGTNFSITKYIGYNRIINKQYIEYYRQYWIDRNEKLHIRSMQ